MTAPRIVDATTSDRLDEAAAIVFEYLALTEGEVGRNVPRTPDELPPALRAAHSSLAAQYARPGALFLAVQSNATIGCVGVRPAPTADAQTVEVSRLYVRTPYRRRGVAAALMHAAHQHARTHGFTRSVLTVMPSRSGAIASYRHLGYTAVPAAYPIAYDMVWLAKCL
jgi:GNAT superfamily N-acetyltransferase